MIPEEETTRRGEPVIVYGRKGTIEWGGVTKLASIYCEAGGRLVRVRLSEIQPDPGGARPVWASIQRRRLAT